MVSSRPITVLHLSDLQFGKNNRFKDEDGGYKAFQTNLIDDLSSLRKPDIGLIPDLIIVTGDLAEYGLPSEFEQAGIFLHGIADSLELLPERVIVIPGNHDINRKACESYFNACAASEEEPVKPYADKWRQWTKFFESLYHERPEIRFTGEEPWTLFEIADMKVVVAGLNSTMADSHRDEDHYGYLDDRQLRWFAERLERSAQKGWLRLGAVHHHPVPGGNILSSDGGG